MVPFAGYAMPVQYPAGILAEHRQCRHEAALFDVSHMGQLLLKGADAAAALETLVPVDVDRPAAEQAALRAVHQRPGRPARRPDDHAPRGRPVRHRQRRVQGRRPGATCASTSAAAARSSRMFDRALLALQGPMAVHAMARLSPGIEKLTFMTGGFFDVAGVACYVTRSGYTGEDGFEISVAAADADKLARTLLAQPEVKPVGLGARDSLRLEAGLCLYGHDIDTDHHAGRGRAHLGDPEGAPPRRRARGRLSRARTSSAGSSPSAR